MSNIEPNITDIVAQLATIAFEDLIILAKKYDQRSVFEILYYDRKDAFTFFDSIMEGSATNATNVLIVGDAGVGKSNFIYKLVSSNELIDRNNIFPIIIDYRNVVPLNTAGCLMDFVKGMVDYFDQIDNPINTLKENTQEMAEINIKCIYEHLHDYIPAEELTKHLVIILDDFDYAEDNWYELLEYFIPFCPSYRASVVLTVRPPLLASIQDYDDRFSQYFIKHVQKIDLHSLEVGNVIATRIGLFLAERERESIYARIQRTLKRNKNPLEDIIKDMGITKLNANQRYDYPFTEKHNTFMRRISNGNLREIFDIAIDTLVYFYDEDNQIEERLEDDEMRKVLGREGVMKLFYDDYKNKKTSFKIINLHKHLSKSGNSLKYNVLEAVQSMGIINERFYEILEQYGHSKTAVDRAIITLANKQHRLICPTRVLPVQSIKGLLEYYEYETTDKGRYYLQIAEWDEYIERCETCGNSLIKDSTLSQI